MYFPQQASVMHHVTQQELDGVSIADVLTKGSNAPSRTLIHHCGREIHALRFIYGRCLY